MVQFISPTYILLCISIVTSALALPHGYLQARSPGQSTLSKVSHAFGHGAHDAADIAGALAKDTINGVAYNAQVGLVGAAKQIQMFQDNSDKITKAIRVVDMANTAFPNPYSVPIKAATETVNKAVKIGKAVPRVPTVPMPMLEDNFGQVCAKIKARKGCEDKGGKATGHVESKPTGKSVAKPVDKGVKSKASSVEQNGKGKRRNTV